LTYEAEENNYPQRELDRQNVTDQNQSLKKKLEVLFFSLIYFISIFRCLQKSWIMLGTSRQLLILTFFTWRIG